MTKPIVEMYSLEDITAALVEFVRQGEDPRFRSIHEAICGLLQKGLMCVGEIREGEFAFSASRDVRFGPPAGGTVH